MTLQTAAHALTSRPSRMRSCPHCSGLVIAPEASEFVGDGNVRHVWSCESCGQAFETNVRLTADPVW